MTSSLSDGVKEKGRAQSGGQGRGRGRERKVKGPGEARIPGFSKGILLQFVLEKVDKVLTVHPRSLLLFLRSSRSLRFLSTSVNPSL